MRDIEEEQTRSDFKGALTVWIAQKIETFDGSVTDAHRVVDLLPDEIVQPHVDDVRDRLAGVYRAHLRPEEIVLIRDYLHSEIAATVVALVHAQADFNGRDGRVAYSSAVQLVSLDTAVLDASLSADERAVFEAFLDGPAGRALTEKEMKIGFEQVGTLLSAQIAARTEPIRIDDAVLCMVMRDERAVSFPNKIQRREALAQVGSC